MGVAASVRNNVQGLNILRQNSYNTGQLSKSLEKLASGYRVNRSGDDAAGLSISEKMRIQLTALDKAVENSQDGLRLIQTGEGALAEIHDMLNRLSTLSEQAANGTYNDIIDREAMQKEMDSISNEVDRIAKNTNFNGIGLFQDLGAAFENVQHKINLTGEQLDEMTLNRQSDIINSLRPKNQIQTVWDSEKGVLTEEDLKAAQEQKIAAAMAEVQANTKADEISIVYIDNAVTATTSATGSANNLNSADNLVVDATSGTKLSDILKTEIVPQTVENIINNYTCFQYLQGSTLGIGLKLYDDSSTNVLASVTCGTNFTTCNSYTLSVNVATLKDASGNFDPSKRSDLESTIAHEMIHAFMDEATTAGMFGVDPSNPSSSGTAHEFPDWFVEGMAQTASGPGNWISSLGSAPTDAAIKNYIDNYKLGGGSSGSQYGAGYLACMYLGAVASTGTGKLPTAINAATILSGLNKVMQEVVNGQSLNNAVKTLTNGAFEGIWDFADKFNAGGTDVCQFVRDLITAKGSGLGGLASDQVDGAGNSIDALQDTDLAPDNSSNLVNTNLFELNVNNSTVQNIYPSSYPVTSGGSTSGTGVSPTTGATPSAPANPSTDTPSSGGASGGTSVPVAPTVPDPPAIPTVPTIPTGPVGVTGPTAAEPTGTAVTTSDGLFTITGGVENIDWSYDNITGTLTILQTGTATALKISGGVGSDSNIGAGEFGQIKLEDNCSRSLSLFLDGVTCDTGDTVGTTGSAFDLGAGNTVSLNIKDGTTNTFTSGTGCAGIAVGDGTELVINGSTGKLSATGGNNGAGIGRGNTSSTDMTSSITINGGDITAVGTGQGAGIGGTVNSDFGNIVINGGTVKAEGGSSNGAGIGASSNASVGDITITGGKVDATSYQHSAAIGGGHGTSSVNGEITITGGEVMAVAKYHGTGIGAGCQGTSGTILIGGDAKVTTQGGNDASGVGASSSGKCGDIFIIGNATLTATGGNNGAGIGAGSNQAVGRDAEMGSIYIDTTGTVTATGGANGAGIGGGASSKLSGTITVGGSGIVNATGGDDGAGIGVGANGATVEGIVISGTGTVNAKGGTHGAGIGVGSNGSTVGSIFLDGSGTVNATGGDYGAGIGAGASNSTVEDGIVISGDIDVNATGGANGAGIGAGANSSSVGNIIIDTSGMVTATSESGGTGIGSGNGNTQSGGGDNDMSVCGDIWIKQGTVKATGPVDCTGIGSGAGSVCGDILIGDPENDYSKVIVTATGGLTNDGGNIVTYSDSAHQNPNQLTILGKNTSVCPGEKKGEGLYATCEATDENGDTVYAYKLNLFGTDSSIPNMPLPKGAVNIRIKATAKDGTVKEWSPDITHSPLDEDNIYLWMSGQNQTLEISFEFRNREYETSLNLIYYPQAGMFRTKEQPTPADAQIPTLQDGTQDGVFRTPGEYDPVLTTHDPMTFSPMQLQIGTDSSEVMYIPKFYLSSYALGLTTLDIATQEDAWQSMDTIQSAIKRVSDIRGTYGALQNRLEHNINSLRVTSENVQESESAIRDTDMAKEMMSYTKFNILSQASQAMLAQCNQQAGSVMQLLQ